MLEKFLRALLTPLLKLLFRLEVHGLENYRNCSGGTLIIANHQSFLDPFLLAVMLPEKPGFAMNTHQAGKWYFKPLISLVDIYPLDPMQPMSMKSFMKRIKDGGKAVIFPEGRITVTGGVMKIYDGAGAIAVKTDATILPVWIEGAQYSHLSRMQGKLRLRWFPKIIITIAAPSQLPEAAKEDPSQYISDALTETAFQATPWRKPLLDALLDAIALQGAHRRIAEDIQRKRISYRTLLTKCLVLKRKLLPSDASHFVGVLLPTSLAGVVTFITLHMLGRTPAMLNFTAGEKNLLLAAETAQLKTIITSRSFIDKGRLEDIVAALGASCTILYLEDIREKLTITDKLCGLLGAYFPRLALRDIIARQNPDDPAALLFTSGSEGVPKGVALSHANILANIMQAKVRLSFTERDALFNALPIFHSFGLTIGTLLPLILGIRVFLFPSPLQYRAIPELCYDTDATILLGTDTFFNGWARYAHPFDFHTVRLAVAGAERLKPETQSFFAERFHVNILQGYGVTETSPAASFNTPLEHKSGSVGRLFPGMRAKLEPVPGIERGGRLLLSGPNIMLGYMRHSAPGIIEPQGEWHDTGDIVDIDGDGYIHILGRAKRFAKIGGEMVSLTVVEELASRHWPDVSHASLAVPDAKKGEQIILFTETGDCTRESLIEHAKTGGFPEIALPRKVIVTESIPKLGSGKTDYVKLKEMLPSPSPQGGEGEFS